ncbi:hypothetical protein [Embleya sp. NPDC005971]|uniref:hypothetical protein n=1 Tax=Embleya sp. NPDC005971 TaxID=3156724 RepID=UPI0033FECCA8
MKPPEHPAVYDDADFHDQELAARTHDIPAGRPFSRAQGAGHGIVHRIPQGLTPGTLDPGTRRPSRRRPRTVHTIALRRGSVTSAIRALERSAELPAGPAQHGRRLLLAAEYAFRIGRAEIMGRLVTAATHDRRSDCVGDPR